MPGTDGPAIQLPAGRTDAQLREALRLYDHVRLLQVTLTDADALLGCYQQQADADAMRALGRLLFLHEWCYRPFEMTAEWTAVERRGKPKHLDEPWCVWGFKNPEVPKVCAAS